MNPILLFTLLAFLTPISARQPPFSNAADIVDSTCKKIAAGDSIEYNLCRSLFDSSPGSHKADLKGLGVISIGFTKKSAKHVIAVLDDLIEKNKNHRQSYKMQCLEQCKEEYSDSMADLTNSAKAIASGRSKEANYWLSDCLVDAVDCEDCFSDGEIRSPLAEEDEHYVKVVTIPLAITDMLNNAA